MFRGLTRTLLAALILVSALTALVAPVAAQTDPTIQVELVGPIEALTLDSITVNGLLIDTTGAEISTALAVDIIVKVEAVQLADGTLQATQVSTPDLSDLLPGEVELVGQLQAMTATQAQIFGMDIDLTGAEVQAGLMLGELVQVHARYTNGQWVAREIAPYGPMEDPGSDATPDPNAVQAQIGDELEFTGTLDQLGEGFIVVSGQQIDVTGAEIKAGLVVGALVKVHFALVNGEMVAFEVEPALSGIRDQDRDRDQTQDQDPIQDQTRDQTQDQDQLRDNSNDNTTVDVPADCVVTPPQNWIRYTVRAGDTLSGLALRTNARLGDLAQANCIRDSHFIVVGMDIFLPSWPVPLQLNTNTNANANTNGNIDAPGNGNYDDHDSDSGNMNSDDHGSDDHGSSHDSEDEYDD